MAEARGAAFTPSYKGKSQRIALDFCKCFLCAFQGTCLYTFLYICIILPSAIKAGFIGCPRKSLHFKVSVSQTGGRACMWRLSLYEAFQ